MAEGKRSFVEAVLSKRPEAGDSFDRQFLFPKNYHEAFQNNDNSKQFIRRSVLKDGKPAILLSNSDTEQLADCFHLSLIEKFPINEPKLDFIRIFFNKLKLYGKWNIGLLDGRHLLIQLTSLEDYTLLFARGSLMIGKSYCKILKWTPEFDYSLEPSFAPIWIRLPGLKLHLFHKQILFSIAAVLGRPLKLDSPTFNISRPSIARILIEVDVSIPLAKEIWIGSSTDGYWQKVEPEFLPVYCTHYRRFGHSMSNCFHLHPQFDRRNKSEVVDMKSKVPSVIDSMQKFSMEDKTEGDLNLQNPHS